MTKPRVIMNPPRMDDKELRDRTLAIIDSQYGIYLRKLHINKKETDYG